MDPEEKRMKILTRLGRETIIKSGTYDMDKARTIIQDHPFYKKIEEKEQEPEENAEAAAVAIMQNNFKSGLSQAEVDAILNGLI